MVNADRLRIALTRLVWWAAIGGGALVVGAQGLSAALADRAPAVAIRFDPGNPDALAGVSDRFLASTDPSDRRRGDIAARAALAHQPLLAAAARNVGVYAGVRGEAKEAVRALQLAQAMSRRDLPTQLVMIEDSVNKGDVSGALTHFDFALRTSQSSTELLLPVLVDASNQPQIAQAMVKMLRQRPLWMEEYLFRLAGQGSSFSTVAGLFGSLHAAGVSTDVRNVELFVRRAVAAGQWSPAWTVYRTLRPGVRPDEVRDAVFAEARRFDVPFEWSLSDDVSLGVSVDGVGDHNELRFSAAADGGGGVARQLLLMNPGSHSVEVAVTGNNAPATDSPFLHIDCWSGSRLTRLDLPVTTARIVTARTIFVVPQHTCPAQWVSLDVRAVDRPEGIAGSVRRIAVR